MKRHELVINLEKMVRFSKLFNNYYSIGEAEEYCDSIDDISEYICWLNEIESYLRKNAGDSMEKRIREMPPPRDMLAFVENDENHIDDDIRLQLKSFANSFVKLQQFCDKRHGDSKGIYRNLPDALANEEAASLLYRAIEAGYLDFKFMPTEGTTTQMLRIIGFAVGKILGFKQRPFWAPFNWLWYKQNKGKLAASHVSRYMLTRFKDLIDLYPEVDFKELMEPDYSLRFATDKSDDALRQLCKDLKTGGYIDKSTTTAQFLGMFGRSTCQKPVNWIREQRTLSFFIYIALKETNRAKWDIAKSRFLVNGNFAHRDSMSSGLASIKKMGRMCDFDVDIVRIVNKFMNN